MHVLNSLGWLWRQNGVELTVVIDGRALQVFVPMQRVRLVFGNELAQAGYHEPSSVGDFSVGGMFDFVKRAVKSIGKAAGHAVKRAASSVTRTAGQFGSAALNAGRAVITNPYVRAGLAAGSLAMPVLAPVALGVEAANRYGSIAHAAQNFVRHPTFGGAVNLASNAVPTQYRSAFNAARSFAAHPGARGLVDAAQQYAPGVAQGVNVARRFAARPGLASAMSAAQHYAAPHMPALPGGFTRPAVSQLRRAQAFQSAMRRFG